MFSFFVWVCSKLDGIWDNWVEYEDVVFVLIDWRSLFFYRYWYNDLLLGVYGEGFFFFVG